METGEFCSIAVFTLIRRLVNYINTKVVESKDLIDTK